MNKNEEHIARVEAYFRHELSDSEVTELKSDLQKDDDLHNLFKEYQLAFDVVDREAEKDLREKFKDWEISKSPSKSGFSTLGIAASIVLLIGFYFVFIYEDDITSLELAESYYAIPEAPSNSMGDSDQEWSDGVFAFGNGDFTSAIQQWEKISDPTYEQSYFLGHAYFNVNAYNQSAQSFLTLSDGTSSYALASKWYLALSYLALEDHEAFERITLDIMDESNPYNSEMNALYGKYQKRIAED